MNKILETLRQLLIKLAALLGFPEKEVPVKPVEPALIPPPPPPTAPVHQSRINLWAFAIQKQEGFSAGTRSYKNSNPGNLKWSDYTKTLGPIGKDSDNFCVFHSYEAGFKALCQFLTDAASNKLIPYKDKTLAEFTQIYAEPPNGNYLKGICVALNVESTIPIKKLL